MRYANLSRCAVRNALIGRRFKPFHLVSEFKHNGVEPIPGSERFSPTLRFITQNPINFGKGVKLDQVEVENAESGSVFNQRPAKVHIRIYSYLRKRPDWVEKYNRALGISFRLAPKGAADENEDLKKKLASRL